MLYFNIFSKLLIIFNFFDKNKFLIIYYQDVHHLLVEQIDRQTNGLIKVTTSCWASGLFTVNTNLGSNKCKQIDWLFDFDHRICEIYIRDG